MDSYKSAIHPNKISPQCSNQISTVSNFANDILLELKKTAFDSNGFLR